MFNYSKETAVGSSFYQPVFNHVIVHDSVHKSAHEPSGQRKFQIEIKVYKALVDKTTYNCHLSSLSIVSSTSMHVDATEALSISNITSMNEVNIERK